MNPQKDIANPTVTPATSTDGAAGVAAGHWHIGIVPPRAEKAVRDRLLSLGHEAYAATRKEVHLWRRNERRVVENVLITNIVFVRTMDKELEGLKKHRILSFMRDVAKKTDRGSTPYAVVRDSEMQVLQAMLAQDDFEVAFTPSDFTLGEYVEVLGFDTGDHLAQIVRLPNDNKSYVGIRVNFLGCAYMQVPLTRIQKVKE